MTEDEWKDIREHGNNDESLHQLQNSLFQKKWPNFNIVLNYFRLSGPQDFSPSVINQLDCVPPPFKFLPNYKEPQIEPNPIPHGELVPMTDEEIQMISDMNSRRDQMNSGGNQNNPLDEMESVPPSPLPTAPSNRPPSPPSPPPMVLSNMTSAMDKNKTIYLQPAKGEQPKTFMMDKSDGFPKLILKDIQKEASKSSRTQLTTPTRKRGLSDPSLEDRQADRKRASDDTQSS
jgi:hypothetical protein